MSTVPQILVDSVDPVVEAYLPGVDRSLLRENLRLSVEERFARFESFMRGIEALRGAVSSRNGPRNANPASE
jgi:hypothetical protein